jgi:hypothetical protein
MTQTERAAIVATVARDRGLNLEAAAAFVTAIEERLVAEWHDRTSVLWAIRVRRAIADAFTPPREPETPPRPRVRGWKAAAAGEERERDSDSA